jgi:hypothetical protein
MSKGFGKGISKGFRCIVFRCAGTGICVGKSKRGSGPIVTSAWNECLTK